MDWMHILITVCIWLIGAIPLYIALHLLGGRGSLLKVVLVNLGIGFIDSFIEAKFNMGWIIKGISFLVLLLIYKLMFDLGWLRAILVWALQFVFTVVMLFLAYRYVF